MRTVRYYKNSHTFVICVYGESIYLEECISSILAQSVESRILMATSTPNEYICSIAKRYAIPLYVNTQKKGIADDWNFAYQCAGTPLVTLAHQDDRYCRSYTEKVLAAVNNSHYPLIVFTNYNELRRGQGVKSNRLLKIKRMMLLPMKVRIFQKSRFIRRRILSFGNAICCPSVTFVKENLHGFAFRNNMKSNIDWQAWEELSRRKGEFVYVSTDCMEHRIHEESATSSLLRENRRKEEDMQVLCSFWPQWAAKIIEYFYQKSEKSNELK